MRKIEMKKPPPAEMQRGGFFCRTDSTGLTDFCAIVLVVWERLCNFALINSTNPHL